GRRGSQRIVSSGAGRSSELCRDWGLHMRSVASPPRYETRDRGSITRGQRRLVGSPMRGWRIFSAALLCLAAGIPAAAQVGARYVGVATCSGSTCHGRAEGNGAVVRQDEIATWQE